jgi:redox-sensitive bicupin YhaK (pirin superfamily)
MGTIRIVEADAVQWARVGDFPGSEERFSEAELNCHARVHHPGSEADPQLFELRVPPNTEIPSHAHTLGEIIYVAEGELHFGKQVLPAGSSVFIDGQTLYSFRSGPDGLRFLNFRPRQDSDYLTKDEFLALRKG